MTIPKYPARSLRICYLNAEPHILDSSRIHLEKKLRLLGDFSIHTIKSLADPHFSPCDLLTIAAQKIPSEQFPKWLEGLSQKIQAQARIWVPALIVAQAPFPTLREVLAKAVNMNWYFDIVSEDHLESLPIRVANLLRIHDHLHELARYEETLNSLSQKIDSLSSEIGQIKSGK